MNHFTEQVAKFKFYQECVYPDFYYDDRKYSVFVAGDNDVIRNVLKLRYEVFNLEYQKGLKKSHGMGLDSDSFDAQCHHLVVVENASNEVVGTYRMQTMEMAKSGLGFYSAIEFDLSVVPEPLLKQSVEIGRACIHKNHRNGRVLYLLWKGLAAYLIYRGKTTLFGCCSLYSTSEKDGLQLFQKLQQNDHLAAGLMVSAKTCYQCQYSEFQNTSKDNPEIPLLFQKYLDFGAKVCSVPAIDHEFGTIDYLVLLHIHQLDRKIYDFFVRGLVPPERFMNQIA